MHAPISLHLGFNRGPTYSSSTTDTHAEHPQSCDKLLHHTHTHRTPTMLRDSTQVPCSSALIRSQDTRRTSESNGAVARTRNVPRRDATQQFRYEVGCRVEEARGKIIIEMGGFTSVGGGKGVWGVGRGAVAASYWLIRSGTCTSVTSFSLSSTWYRVGDF